MKIEVTFNEEKVIYLCDYNPASEEIKYTGPDDDNAFELIRTNQRLIGRAIDDAYENTSGKVLNGSGYFNGHNCIVKLYKTN